MNKMNNDSGYRWAGALTIAIAGLILLFTSGVPYQFGFIGGAIGGLVIGMNTGKIFDKFFSGSIGGFLGLFCGYFIGLIYGALGVIMGFSAVGWLGGWIFEYFMKNRERYLKGDEIIGKEANKKETELEIQNAELALQNAIYKGIDLPENLVKLLLDSKDAFESKDYNTAANNARICRQNLDSLLKEHIHKTLKAQDTVLKQLQDDAETKFKFVKNLLERAADYGISTLEKENEILNTAEEMLNKKDYESALSHVKKCEAELDRYITDCTPDMSIRFPKGMMYKFWNQCDIVLTNNGTAHACDITLYLEPSFEILDKVAVPLIEAGKNQSVRTSIKPNDAGDVPLKYSIRFSDKLGRTYIKKYSPVVSVKMITQDGKIPYASGSLDIKRDYGVMPNNDMRFGIRVENNTGFVVTDLQVILDYPRTLFSLQDSEVQSITTVNPGDKRTVYYFIKPLICIHNKQINALITYRDHVGNKHSQQMRSKEVHCIIPFLKERPMAEAEYRNLSENSELLQEGISFNGISVDEMAQFLYETIRHILYRVKEYDIDSRKIILLSGESAGEKAYYLLTAIIQERGELAQIVLQAFSDKKDGLNGFMDELVEKIRHTIDSLSSAKEIGIIENTQVINIIDSVVQRTNFNMGISGSEMDDLNVTVKNSVIQRTDFGTDKER